jgi:hypothetical protein
MTKVEKIVAGLEKLYAKRAVIEKQIAELQKKLADAVKIAAPTVEKTVKKETKKSK